MWVKFGNALHFFRGRMDSSQLHYIYLFPHIPILHLIVSTHPYFYFLCSSFCQLCIVPFFFSHSLIFLWWSILVVVVDQYMKLSDFYVYSFVYLPFQI